MVVNMCYVTLLVQVVGGWVRAFAMRVVHSLETELGGIWYVRRCGCRGFSGLLEPYR